MSGTCAHCHAKADVSRYRLEHVGLRWMCADCVARLRAIGMHIEFEAEAEPRQRREPVAVERRRSLRALFFVARLAA